VATPKRKAIAIAITTVTFLKTDMTLAVRLNDLNVSPLKTRAGRDQVAKSSTHYDEPQAGLIRSNAATKNPSLPSWCGQVRLVSAESA